MKRSDDGKVSSTVPHGGTVTLTEDDLLHEIFKNNPIIVGRMPPSSWTEADKAYVNAAFPDVEEGSRRIREVEDRIWYEIAKASIKD